MVPVYMFSLWKIYSEKSLLDNGGSALVLGGPWPRIPRRRLGSRRRLPRLLFPLWSRRLEVASSPSVVLAPVTLVRIVGAPRGVRAFYKLTDKVAHG